MSSRLSLFTAEQRQGVLERLVAGLETEERVSGAVLVGSGAAGFSDRFSDLDVLVAVAPGHEVRAVWARWRERLPQLLPVLCCHGIPNRPDGFFHDCLLEGFLPLHLLFAPLGGVVAERLPWRVLLDREGVVQSRLEESWAQRETPEPLGLVRRRLGGIWGPVMQAAVGLARNQCWPALAAVEAIRGDALELACLRHGVERHGGRGVAALPEPTVAGLAAAVPAGLSVPALQDALRAAVEAFFAEAEALDVAGVTEAARLHRLLDCYLSQLAT